MLYTDADLPFDFSLIPQLVSSASSASVVAGFRLNRGEGPRRWLLTKGYNLLIWLFFGLALKDVNFACKIFPKRFLQNAELTSSGSFIDVEMLLETRRLDLEIVQYPLAYFPRERGLSTLSRPAVVLNILREMIVYSARNSYRGSALMSTMENFPLGKLSALMTMLCLSLALFISGSLYSPGRGWLPLTIEASIASIVFGWRIGLIAGIFGVISLECLLLWGQPSLLAVENVQFLVWAVLGVLCSQISSGTWKLAYRSISYNSPE